LNILEYAVKWAFGFENVFAPLRPSDDYFAFKYNFIEIESNYDLVTSSDFVSAEYLLVFDCGKMGSLLYGRPY
jgi:hypothetical protein